MPAINVTTWLGTTLGITILACWASSVVGADYILAGLRRREKSIDGAGRTRVPAVYLDVGILPVLAIWATRRFSKLRVISGG
jgi:hypothetical protein